MTSLKEGSELRKSRAKPDGPYSLRLYERHVPLLLLVSCRSPALSGAFTLTMRNQHDIELRTIDADKEIRAKLAELHKPYIGHQFATYKDLTQVVGELLTGDRANWDKVFYHRISLIGK